MTVAGICLVRNAEDIITAVVEHALTELDFVIVADNLSTDRTRERLESIDTARLMVVDDLDPAHRQGSKTTTLAAQARSLGADWVVPFDSDEVWYSPFGKISDVISAIEDHLWIAPAVLFDHVRTGDDPVDANPVKSITWRRRAPGPFPKVACRTADDLVIHEGNHGAEYGTNAGSQGIPGLLAVRHFPYRSAEQMFAKAQIGAAALRAAPELSEETGKHWRDYDALGADGVREAFYGHFYADDPATRTDLVFDPAPYRRWG